MKNMVESVKARLLNIARLKEVFPELSVDYILNT